MSFCLTRLLPDRELLIDSVWLEEKQWNNSKTRPAGFELQTLEREREKRRGKNTVDICTKRGESGVEAVAAVNKQLAAALPSAAAAITARVAS